jgi:hypothetical protein
MQRIVIGPEEVADHVLRSIERNRGETTVPWFYGPLGTLQDMFPNVATVVFGRMRKAP